MDWTKYPYFKSNEFDSSDEPGSGESMDEDFIKKLSKVRVKSGVPMIINNGFRTEWKTQDLIDKGYKVSDDSPHPLGLAADIRVTNSSDRFKIKKAAYEVGFRRIGHGKDFIHLDTDFRSHKAQDVEWHYY
jgi:uncharacterized protein YcbK (DUF882 family)